MFAYSANNPVNYVDSSGQFFETVFDVVSIGFSIVDVATNPYDPWAWAGLAGDIIDLCPFVTGVGESVKAIGAVVDIADTAYDAVRVGKGTIKYADKIILDSWQDAEKFLRNKIDSVGPVKDRTFEIPGFDKKRIEDAYNPSTNLIGESKYGYQSASSTILSEVERDATLVSQGYTVEWHFFASQKSHTAGMSKKLQNKLINSGINIIMYY